VPVKKLCEGGQLLRLEVQGEELDRKSLSLDSGGEIKTCPVNKGTRTKKNTSHDEKIEKLPGGSVPLRGIRDNYSPAEDERAKEDRRGLRNRVQAIGYPRNL